MFKKLVHYITSKRLEKHCLKTQCMIDEYERRAAASHARVQAQADKYTSEIERMAEQRHKQIADYMAWQNRNVEKVYAYSLLLRDLQQSMFACTESWIRQSLSEQRWKIEQEKSQVLLSTLRYLDELAEEMIRLSRSDDRLTWQKRIAERPLSTTDDTIRQHAKRVQGEIESEAKAYETELRRIKSYKNSLFRQLQEVKKNRTACKEALDRDRNEHREQKKQLRTVYHECRDRWDDLRTDVEHHYQYSNSESELASQWLSRMPQGGTFNEIRQLIQDAQEHCDSACSEVQSLYERMDSIKSRIKSAHDNQDYSRLDTDKAERQTVFNAIKQAKERQDCVYKARNVLKARRTEIIQMLDRIRDFHPSKTVEDFFALLSQEDDDMYWSAIGLKTRNLQGPEGRAA
ncbi:hypothetical protein [Kosakonia cowanii]|uniref:hypothetical protein n=1 Tax=Kosakonia cowanii TaxID=208223 RepID=UPI002FDE6626